ncbi:MAG: hypothetical protein J7L66_02310 [Anaerolineaceae bacterium]|nr:hypothetical protein [Anaerolineaceae bacterium]
MTGIMTNALPLLGAGIAAYIIYIFGSAISEDLFKKRSSERVKDMIGIEETHKVKATDFGSPEYKIRLAFARFNMDVYKREKLALNVARLLAGLLFGFAMRFILGLPVLASSSGVIAGMMIVNSFASNAWIKLCNSIDNEIPIFLSGFTSTIQVNPNVLQAVEEESSVLAVNSPLKKWLQDRFVKSGQEHGISALDGLIEEAFRISNSLGVMVFLIGRLWRTGGMEWQRSFSLASTNLEGVIEARMTGVAAGSAAKNAVKMIIMVTMFVSLIMARNPIFSRAMDQPIVQIVYAASTLMMVFGYEFIGKMIERLM